MVNSVLDTLSYQLLPGQCLICQQRSHRQRDLCGHCETELPWLGEHCQCCAQPLPRGENTALCGRCQRHPPHFSHCLAAWEYRLPLDHLLTDFKHRRRYGAGRVMAELWLSRRGPQALNPAPELLLPVPLHWRRRWQRGFNQARLLAEIWSQALGIAVADVIQRQHHTPAQQSLDARQRRRNLNQAFQLSHPAQLAGRHVALVDDVLTTGTTAHTLAGLLLAAGARQVDIWVLARTP